MRYKHSSKARVLQGNAATGIPSGEAHECVYNRKRKEEQYRLEFINAAVVVSGHIEQKLAYYQPSEQVQPKPARISEDRMHA